MVMALLFIAWNRQAFWCSKAMLLLLLLLLLLCLEEIFNLYFIKI
jgi:hypothetical protein